MGDKLDFCAADFPKALPKANAKMMNQISKIIFRRMKMSPPRNFEKSALKTMNYEL